MLSHLRKSGNLYSKPGKPENRKMRQLNLTDLFESHFKGIGDEPELRTE